MTVKDAVKAAWQDVEQETANELVRRQRHYLAPCQVVRAIILVVEGHAAPIVGDEPRVRDRHPVGVARQIGEDGLRPRERRLSILPIIKDLGSRSATLTIRYTGKGARSYGKRTQKGNAIFV